MDNLFNRQNTTLHLASYINFSFVNINGLHRQLTELTDFVMTNNIEVMMVNETHLRPCHKAKIPNFKVYREDRLHHRGGGNVIYVKKHIKSVQYDFNNLQTLEVCAVLIEDRKLGKILVVSAYNRPANTISQEDLKTIFDVGLPTIIAGDLNSKSTAWGCRTNNPNGIILQDFILNEGIHLVAPDEPTYYSHFTTHHPDILDIALMKDIPCTPHLQVKNGLSSDHLPIIFTLYGVENPPTLVRMKTDWENFHILSANIPTANPPMSTIAEINQVASDITIKIKKDLDSSSKPATDFQPGLPPELKQAIKDKNKLKKVYQRTLNPRIKSRMNAAHRRVKDLLQQHRIDEWDAKIRSLSNLDNSVWKMTKALKRQPITIGPVHGPGGLAYTEADMAEVFATSLENQFKPHTTPANQLYNEYVEQRVKDLLLTPSPSSIPFTSPQEVRKIINNLNSKKAPGIDGISNKALKNLSEKAIILLTNLFNACLRTKHFPTIWKHAATILFKKPGKDSKVAANYRPISLLPTLSKVLEKIINFRLKQHIEINNIISSNQYGFRGGHSTTHQIHRIVEIISNSFNSKKFAAGVFLDIEKAFDSLWHPGLMYKMLQTTIPTSLTHIINSFLSNRTFQVRINNTTSTIRPIRAGVPQGSINGPSLFNIYINDFPQTRGCTLAQFADDTAIIATSKSSNKAMIKVQTALKEVEDWCCDWRVKINPTKSEAIIFQNNRKPVNTPSPTIYGSIIPITNQVKYLGVHLDKKLNFKTHITQTIRKAQIAAIALNPITGPKSQLPLHTKKLLYETMIRPILLYACPAWATAARTHRNKIQVFQNKSLRRITGAPWFIRNRALHHDLKIETIDSRILAEAHNHFTAVENSYYEHIRQITSYDPTVMQPFKRPRTIHHNAKW